MARTLKSDRLLFGSTLLLVCASVIMVYSASSVQMDVKTHNPWAILFKQLEWVVLGVATLLVAMRVDYHAYRRPEVIWSLVGIVTVGLLAVFLFPASKGTYRWLYFRGVSLQPAEFAKLAAILFTAALLERRMHRINDLRYSLAPVGIVLAVLGGLILKEPDFGTATMLVLAVGAIIFAAGVHYRYLLGFAAALLPAAAVYIYWAPYRYQRLLLFLNPGLDPMDKGFQANQAIIAVGSGGAFGKGIMGGIQKLFFIPEPHSDFIYSVIAEELGLIGTTLVLGCFVVIAWRGFRAAVMAPDRFGSLLALGLSALIALQGLVNMSMVIGLLPTEGIPLPFVSNGGSSLIVSLIGIGILLNISQQTSRVGSMLPVPVPQQA